MQNIIIVEPGSSALYIANAVKLLGYKPIILCSIDEYSGDQKRYLLEHEHYNVKAYSADNIIKCIQNHKIGNIAGIMSTADRFIYSACKAAIDLGVRGMDPALLTLNNKRKVAELIPEDSPTTIIFNRNNIPFGKLSKLLKSSAIVVKPAMSAGAKGLFEISSDNELKNILTYMQRETQVKVLDGDWIAQAKIDGSLYSLEGYVLNNSIHIIGISKRNRIKYTETTNEFPVNKESIPEIYNSLLSILEKLVNISNYKNGYFHSEFIVRDNKCYLIDANFGRLGGAFIVHQISLSFGKKVEEIYSHVICTTLFYDNTSWCDNFYSSTKKKTFAISYGISNEAVLNKIIIPDDFQSYHQNMADIGEKVKPVGVDNRAHIGFAVGDPEILPIEVSKIRIETDIGVQSPVY